MKYLIIVILLALVSCAPTIETFMGFKVGETKICNVGESMVVWGYNQTNPLSKGSEYYQEQRKELIFNGYDGKTIFIAYREFTNDMARQAFSNELKYPSDTKFITYQDRKLEILKIDGSSIIFKILN